MVKEGLALKILLGILSLMIIFHVLLLFTIIPYQLVWGGRITSRSEMIRYESISLIVISVMWLVAAHQAGIIRSGIHPTIINVSLWLMFGFFLLNTAGNLLSSNKWEKLVFTPLTLLLSMCCLRVVLVPGRKKSREIIVKSPGGK